MTFLSKTDYLNNETIEEWSLEAEKLYQKEQGSKAIDEKESKIKIRFTIEEILLKFKNTYGTDTKCTITGDKKFNSITFIITQEGLEKDVLYDVDDNEISYDLLSRFKVKPKYEYKKNTNLNKVSFTADRKKSNRTLLYILAGLLLAIVLYTTLSSFSPDSLLYFYSTFTKPIFDKMIAILTAFATPLVFFSVISGITGLGNISSFGKIGSKVCTSFLMTYIIAAVLLITGSIIFYPVVPTSAVTEGDATQSIVRLILDIVPSNLIEPFVKDNDLQVVAIAIFTGIVILLLQHQTKGIRNAISELSTLIYKMMTIVCKLIPLIVFLGIFNLLCETDLDQLSSMLNGIIIFFAGSIIVIVITIIRVSVKTKVNFAIIFKKVLPTLISNLLTSSQVSTLPENMRCCKEDLGIDKKCTDFALPLGIVTYMPCGAIFLGTIAISLSYMGGVPISIFLLAKIAIMSIIIAIAAPPIPGSALTVIPIFFTICTIPYSLFPLAVVFGSILGYILPAFNGFLLQLELIIIGIKTKSINMETLKTPLINKKKTTKN